jgi:hypothetical protein
MDQNIQLIPQLPRDGLGQRHCEGHANLEERLPTYYQLRRLGQSHAAPRTPLESPYFA